MPHSHESLYLGRLVQCSRQKPQALYVPPSARFLGEGKCHWSWDCLEFKDQALLHPYWTRLR